MEFEAFVVSLQSILFFAVGSATLFFGLGLAGLVNAFLLVNLIVLFFAFFLLSKNFRLFKARVDFALWHALVISAFPFLAVGVLDSIFSQLSVVFLSLLSDNVSAALFSAPYKLVVALTILQSNFFVALFPVFSRFFHSKKKSFSFVFDRSAKYVLAFSLPVVAFVFIFSQKIILLFFGPKYFSVSSGLLSPSFALQLMIFVVPLWFLGGIANYALFSAHRQNDVVLSLALAAIAGIALNLFLIPRFLVAGACIALVVSSFISFVVSFYFALLRVHNANILVYFFKTFAATAILYVVLFFSYSLPLAANLFSTIVIYLALVFVFGLFDATDLRIFRQVFLFWKK
jgi:O-antigen/teichoic acid export membrane protein